MERYLQNIQIGGQTKPDDITFPDEEYHPEINIAEEDIWKSLPALEKVRDFFTQHKAFVDLHAKLEYIVHGSPLHLAIYANEKEAVLQMLENGTEVSVQDTKGVTALSLALTLALETSRLDMLECMLEFCETSEAGVHQSLYDVDSEWLDGLFTEDSLSLSQDIFICNWDIPKVIDQLRASLTTRELAEKRILLSKLQNVVVVTGSGATYEASTCGKFLEKSWNKIGSDMLRAIVDAIVDGPNANTQSAGGQPNLSQTALILISSLI